MSASTPVPATDGAPWTCPLIERAPDRTGRMTASAAVPAFDRDAAATRRWIRDIATETPLPRPGGLVRIVGLLAKTARLDVAAAGALESQLHARGMLDDAERRGIPVASLLGDVDADHPAWCVVMPEDGAASPTAEHVTGGWWRIAGSAPLRSPFDLATHALVAARTPQGRCGLFLLRLQHPSVSVCVGHGPASIDLERTPAVLLRQGEPPRMSAVAAPHRIALAAVWWGGAARLLEPMGDPSRRRGADRPFLAAFTAADAALRGARRVLCEAAAAIDGGLDDHRSSVAAARVCFVTANAIRLVLDVVRISPAIGAVHDESDARRIDALRACVARQRPRRGTAPDDGR